MPEQLFRKKSMDRLSSPEELNSYLRVTTPAVWLVLSSVILILVGALFWGGATFITSSVSGTAKVKDGIMVVTFEEDEFAQNVEPGLYVRVGNVNSTIMSVGKGEDDSIFALANTDLSDGTYPASITYKVTSILKLLFN